MIPSDTLLPCVNGWLEARYVKPGDALYNYQGHPVRVTSAVPGTFSRAQELQFYYNPKRDIVLSEDQAFVRTERGAPGIWLQGEWHAPERDQPMDPFLFGLWFGIPNRWRKHSKLYCKPKYTERVIQTLHNANFGIIKVAKGRPIHSKSGYYNMAIETDRSIWSVLHSNFYALPQTVPDCYVYASLRQQALFLEGYLAGFRPNVFYNNNDTVEVVSTNTRLIEQLADVSSLTGRPIALEKFSTPTYRNGVHQWRLRIYKKVRRPNHFVRLSLPKVYDTEPIPGMEIKTECPRGSFLITHEGFALCSPPNTSKF